MNLLDVPSSRARSYLMEHERPVAEVRWHPIWLLKPAAIFLGVLAVTGWLAAVLPRDSPLLDVAGLALLASALWLAWQVGEWFNERLVVTDRRLMLVTGLLTTRVAVMPLRKVTDMTYERPLIGRFFAKYGWGTFVMESAGQDQALHRIPLLPDPDELYYRLSGQIFGDKGLYGSPGAPAAGAAGSRRGRRAGTERPAPRTGPDDPTMIIRLSEDD